MSELTANEATALMAAGMYASPPTEAQMKDGIERAESWLAAHDREVKAEALREAATALFRENVVAGVGDPVSEFRRLSDRADRIESGSES